VCGSVVQYGAVCCSMLQCVAVCCNVLQCVAVCCVGSNRAIRYALKCVCVCVCVRDSQRARAGEHLRESTHLHVCVTRKESSRAMGDHLEWQCMRARETEEERAFE